MNYTRKQFILRQSALELSGSIEANRWQLAQLAHEAERDSIPAWAEIIGVTVRRSPSTIYEWRKAWRLRNSVNPKSKLSISFWVTAANHLTDENEGQIRDWLETCEGDEKITLESARANFPRPEAPVTATEPPLREALLTAISALVDLTQRSDVEPYRSLIELAIAPLRSIMDAVAGRVTA